MLREITIHTVLHFLRTTEINQTKYKLGLPSQNFYCPDEVKDFFKDRFKILIKKSNEWTSLVESVSKGKPLINLLLNNEIPNLEYPKFESNSMVATRKAFGLTLDKFAESLPNLVGGSADLEPSNYTGNLQRNTKTLLLETISEEIFLLE